MVAIKHKKRSKLSRLSKLKQSGVVMLEFSIVLPFLMLVLVATAEVGYLMHQQISLSKSVTAGGRYISTHVSYAGRVRISAETIQNTRNTIKFGNIAGVGTPVIKDLDILKIDITCTYGTVNGNCTSNANQASITIQVNYTYTPVLGELFDTVTGIDVFPRQMSAINIVEPI